MALPPYDRQRLKEVFAGARALPAERRPAYLAEACGGNEALRQEVESLLASDERAKSFLETSAAVQVQDAFAAKNLEGQRIGSYQIEAWIGAGGMGEVYKALDTKLNRQVAIKVLLPAVADDPDRLARFSREAQLLALLNHPHIAQIHGLEDASGLHGRDRDDHEGPSSMSSHCCSQRLATCGWSRIESSACGSSVGLKRRTGRRNSNGG